MFPRINTLSIDTPVQSTQFSARKKHKHDQILIDYYLIAITILPHSIS